MALNFWFLQIDETNYELLIPTSRAIAVLNLTLATSGVWLRQACNTSFCSDFTDATACNTTRESFQWDTLKILMRISLYELWNVIERDTPIYSFKSFLVLRHLSSSREDLKLAALFWCLALILWCLKLMFVQLHMIFAKNVKIVNPQHIVQNEYLSNLSISIGFVYCQVA
jgi:hypothetical protein